MVTRRDIIYISVLIIVLMLFFYIYTKSRYRNVVTVNSRVLRLIKEDNSTSYVKILWMYWEQGIENLHKYHQGAYNKMCFDGWKKLNPDCDIRILNKTTALNYVPELAKFNHLSRAMRSDLLRIKLLERYGGGLGGRVYTTHEAVDRLGGKLRRQNGDIFLQVFPQYV